MNTAIKNILVPVELNENGYSLAKQAGEMARDNHATLHLLHIADMGMAYTHLVFPQFTLSSSFNAVTDSKLNALENLKKELNENYGIPVVTEMIWGKIRKEVPAYVKKKNIDLLLLQENPRLSWFEKLFGTATERIIKKCACQVIIIMNNPVSIPAWHDLVMPVSGVLPVQRMKTIIGYVKKYGIKIHLVTSSIRKENTPDKAFQVLVDALKTIKSYGDIPVECISLDGEDITKAAMDYASSIKADAIMTNNRPAKNKRKGRLKGLFRKFPFLTSNPQNRFHPVH